MTESTNKPAAHEPDPSNTEARKTDSPSHIKLVVGILVVVAVVAAGWGLISRQSALAALRQSTNDAAIPNVTLTQASALPDQSGGVLLPATVQALYTAPIYARTEGYVKAWYTDIGAKVKKGQVLALIDTPDVDDQYRQAQADLATAHANYTLAATTAARWVQLRKANAVSQQDLDNRVGAASADRATEQSSQANLARLKQLRDFQRVVAPFDGVVTQRLTDVGALITAGTTIQLFSVADTSKLRIYVSVPQLETGIVTLGKTAEVELAEYPGKNFDATVTNSSNALDPTNRTLNVELQIDNPDGKLFPGGYAEVNFPGVAETSTLRIPVSAMLFRADGLHVVTAPQPDKNGLTKITLKTISIVRDNGSTLDVSGLAKGESILFDPPDSAADGETVRVVGKS